MNQPARARTGGGVRRFTRQPFSYRRALSRSFESSSPSHFYPQIRKFDRESIETKRERKRKIALKLSKRANFYERTKQVTRVNRVTFSKQIGSKSFSRNEESPFLIDDYNFETSKRERERAREVDYISTRASSAKVYKSTRSIIVTGSS